MIDELGGKNHDKMCQNHKNCLKATQLENKISYLEKNKINIDSLKKS